MTQLRLVFIHGRSQQGRAVSDLEREWLTALRLGLGPDRAAILDRVVVTVPFYGDILAGYASQLDDDLPADIIVRGGPPPFESEYQRFFSEAVNEMVRGLGVTDTQAAVFYDNLVLERGPLNWEWIQALLRAADVISGASAAAIAGFVRDVYVYLSRSKVRREVNQIIADALSLGRAVVVGHSLGSVVAYDVLRTTRNADVPLLLTLGSPLGVGPIRRVLSPLAHPTAVRKWYNAMDERDAIALHPLSAAIFPVIPEIENYTGVRNGTENCHGISGYLSDSVVAQRIYDALSTV